MQPMHTTISQEASPAYLRWEQQSPRYKKDLIIKIFATSILLTLGIALLLGGIPLLSAICPPSVLNLGITSVIFASCVVLGGGLTAGLWLGSSSFKGYHKKKNAVKVCDSIKTNYQKMPTPVYTEFKDGDTYIRNERSIFKGKIQYWVRYGFILKAHRKVLLRLIKKDKAARNQISNLQSLLLSTRTTRFEKEAYIQQIEKKEIECQELAIEWERVMEEKVIPNLPF